MVVCGVSLAWVSCELPDKLVYVERFNRESYTWSGESCECFGEGKCGGGGERRPVVARPTVHFPPDWRRALKPARS